MAILNETKEALNQQLGSPAKASILVGGDERFHADEAWRYNMGRFDVIIGFRGGVSCYACFYKEKLDKPAFDDQDVEVSLSLVAPGFSWSVCERDSKSAAAEEESGETDTPDFSWEIDEYRTSIPDISGKQVAIVACHRTIKPHFLAYTARGDSPQSTTPQDQTEDANGKLDRLLLALNTAVKVEMKIDAAVAVINELAAQVRTMREQMPKIRERRKD